YPIDSQRSIAQVTVKSITPTPGADLNERSTIRAQIEYTITPFDPGAEYYLAPLFDSTEGLGHTFNELERFTDGVRLTGASSALPFSYSVARELQSPRLARPIRVSFYVIVRTASHKSLVIGKTREMMFGPAR